MRGFVHVCHQRFVRERQVCDCAGCKFVNSLSGVRLLSSAQAIGCEQSVPRSELPDEIVCFCNSSCPPRSHRMPYFQQHMSDTLKALHRSTCCNKSPATFSPSPLAQTRGLQVPYLSGFWACRASETEVDERLVDLQRQLAALMESKAAEINEDNLRLVNHLSDARSWAWHSTSTLINPNVQQIVSKRAAKAALQWLDDDDKYDLYLHG